MATGTFIIQPHFRLQEWVAEENGYFRDEGLDYVFDEQVLRSDGAVHDTGGAASGAYQTFEAGRAANVSCACHWTVNVAAANRHGRLWPHAYSVSPAGIFVPADSPIARPEDLAGVPVSVGYQSGSHYATIQALEPFLPREQVTLSFGEGMLFARLDALLEGRARAATLFSGPYYLAEQLGYRKLVDCTFMIAAMINGDPREADLERYFRALRRAQAAIDLRPERFTHFYRREFPARYHARIDTRRWGPGERIVFEPYSAEIFAETRDWIAEHAIFAGRAALGSDDYARAVAPAA